MNRALRAASRAIARVERVLLLGMLFLIVGVNLLQIGIRLLQGLLRATGSEVVLSAPSWPADLNRILVLWIAMVGGSLASLHNEHIKVDFLGRLLPARARAMAYRVTCVVGVAVCLLLVVFSVQFLQMEIELGETLVALPVPLWIIQSIIPVGFSLIAFRFLLHLIGGPAAQFADRQEKTRRPARDGGREALKPTGGAA